MNRYRSVQHALLTPRSWRRQVGIQVTSIILLLFAIIAVGGCTVGLSDPPRWVTLTAQSGVTGTPSVTPLVLNAPTPTGDSSSSVAVPTAEDEAASQVITLWVNETSDEHRAALDRIVEDFSAQSDIQVEVILVSPRLLPELVQTAAISGTLPDVIVHPLEYSIGWAQKGILDSQSATEVINDLGPDTFHPVSLAMLTIDQADEGTFAAVPSDAWQQLIIYRADWFQEQDLAPPDSYDALITAAEAIFEPESIVSGLVAPTDSSLVSTQQVFEYIATANGCDLIDEKGEVSLLHPACLAALDYYRELINSYSPVGVQTDTSSLNAYLAGRTGMIIASPAVLPALAGYDEDFPLTCPECVDSAYLIQNSGIIKQLRGSSEFAVPTSFMEQTNIGLTSTSNRQAAQAFVQFWFEEAYGQWLAVDPERKVPMRLGTSSEPTSYQVLWAGLGLAEDKPGLIDIFGSDLVDLISGDFSVTGRWGFGRGQGELMTEIYQELVISPLLQDMLSGYFTSSQTIIEMQRSVIDLIPGYAFSLPPEPTPTP